jgi:hypothetical protein
MGELHRDRPTPQETEAEREALLRESDEFNRRQHRYAEKIAAEAKAADDAIAAPYREARRLRNLKKMQGGFTIIEAMICGCIILIIVGFAGPALIERSRQTVEKPPAAPQPTIEAKYNWPDSAQTLGYVIRLPTGERMFVRVDSGGVCLLPPLPVETPK